MNIDFINRKLIIFCCLVLLIAVSCKSSYNEISELEKQEWQAYNVNQQLNFANSFGQNETYKVSSVLGGYIKDGDTYNEKITDLIIKNNDTILKNSTGGLKILKDGSDLIVSFSWPHHSVEKVITGTPAIPVYMYNGNTATNVWISAVPSILIDSTHSYIDSVFYSKEIGVFKYTDIYNNTWTKTN